MSEEAQLTPAGDIEVKDEQVEQKEVAPEDMCSQLLYVYGPRYKMLINKLSGRQLKRVMYMLAMYPLQDRDYKPTDPTESEVFNLGDKLLQAKFVLMTKVLTEKLEKEMLQKEEQPVTINESIGENNG